MYGNPIKLRQSVGFMLNNSSYPNLEPVQGGVNGQPHVTGEEEHRGPHAAECETVKNVFLSMIEDILQDMDMSLRQAIKTNPWYLTKFIASYQTTNVVKLFLIHFAGVL